MLHDYTSISSWLLFGARDVFLLFFFFFFLSLDGDTPYDDVDDDDVDVDDDDDGFEYDSNANGSGRARNNGTRSRDLRFQRMHMIATPASTPIARILTTISVVPIPSDKDDVDTPVLLLL